LKKQPKKKQEKSKESIKGSVEFRQQTIEINSYVKLDGIKMQLTAPDLDGDGVVGGTESFTRQVGQQGVSQIIQPSELSEVMKQLNDDNIDPKSGMSNIDMKTRLMVLERNGIVALDSLVALGVCPPECLAFTRQIKRLNVSLGGRGRTEMVDVVNGQRKHDEAKMGFGEKIKNAFGGGGEQ